MARSLRSPAGLMTIYVVLFILGGPWLGPDGAAPRNVPQIAIAVFLAVLAARGIRPARVLMISYSILGAFSVFYGSTHWGASKPFAASFLALGCALAQLGLLVSSPMYQRSRPGWSAAQVRSSPFLPRPRLWVLLSSVAGGLVMALLPFSDGLRETVCPGNGAGSASSCWASGFGYPIAYRFAYNNLAPRGIAVAAWAADWALWSLSLLLVLYLVQLRKSRGTAGPGPRRIAEPVPARP
jgi:hypothetical protein